MKIAEMGQGFGLFGAKSGEPVKLAMQELELSGTLLPMGGRLTVSHRFKSAEKKVLEAVYSFMLPRDAAMRRFRVVGEGFESNSELRPVEQANEMYELGMDRGNLAVLARAYGDGVVNLNVGNIRPGETVTVFLEIAAGVELRDDGFRFRFPFTLAPSYHGQARAAQTGPGTGEMQLPEKLFGDVILPEWHADVNGLHRVGFDLCIETPGCVADLASPSHTLSVRHGETGMRAGLAVEADVPNRDLVLDVRYRDRKPIVLAGKDAAGRGRFAVVLPSTCFGEPKRQQKRVVFLLDRSGSMSSTPIQQAKKAIEACLGALDGDDCFSIVAFDDRCEQLPGLRQATMEAREAARQFLANIDARGGTQLARGVEAAAAMLGNGGGEILLLTDGQVFGGESIISRAKATGIRIHTLGIGSASQDRFLSQISGETGGTGRFLTARERVDVAVLELFAGIGSPAATDVSVESAGATTVAITPEPAGTVFPGTPCAFFGSCDGDGALLRITWTGEGVGSMDVPVHFEEGPLGEAVKLMQGARLTAAAELLGSEPGARRAGRRNVDRVERRLTELAEEYGLANRAMALVAVVVRKGDKPGELPTTHVVPVGMPQDVEMDSYFASAPYALSSVSCCMGVDESQGLYQRIPDAHLMKRMRSLKSQAAKAMTVNANSVDSEMDTLMDIAAAIEADGGMPGRDDGECAVFTLLALLAFHEEGNTENGGPFAAHVRRLCEYLEKTAWPVLEPRKQRLVEGVLEAVRQSKSISGPWLKLAGTHLRRKTTVTPAKVWQTVEKSLQHAV